MLHLQVESHQAAPSQDAGSRRRTWFFQGFGLAGLMLIGVAAMGGLEFTEVPSGSGKPSGHDLAVAFQPRVPGSTSGGVGSVKTAVATAQEKRHATALMDGSNEGAVAEVAGEVGKKQAPAGVKTPAVVKAKVGFGPRSVRGNSLRGNSAPAVVKESTPESQAAAKAAYEANKVKRTMKKAPKVGAPGTPSAAKKRQNSKFDKNKRNQGAVDRA